MGRIEKTVFISYRRMNSFMAREAYQSLTARGYDVFFDYEGSIVATSNGSSWATERRCQA